MTNPSSIARVLAIDPTTKGFGFAVLEGPSGLVDWGLRSVQEDKHKNSLKKCTDLISTYAPTAIVLEDATAPGSRRSERVVALIRDVATLATERDIVAHFYTRAQIRNAFAERGARKRHEIAIAISTQLPELVGHLPPQRKTWMPEDERMHIFDAVSLALAHYHFKPHGTCSDTG